MEGEGPPAHRAALAALRGAPPARGFFVGLGHRMCAGPWAEYLDEDEYGYASGDSDSDSDSDSGMPPAVLASLGLAERRVVRALVLRGLTLHESRLAIEGARKELAAF